MPSLLLIFVLSVGALVVLFGFIAWSDSRTAGRPRRRDDSGFPIPFTDDWNHHNSSVDPHSHGSTYSSGHHDGGFSDSGSSDSSSSDGGSSDFGGGDSGGGGSGSDY